MEYSVHRTSLVKTLIFRFSHHIAAKETDSNYIKTPDTRCINLFVVPTLRRKTYVQHMHPFIRIMTVCWPGSVLYIFITVKLLFISTSLNSVCMQNACYSWSCDRPQPASYSCKLTLVHLSLLCMLIQPPERHRTQNDCHMIHSVFRKLFSEDIFT